MTLSPREAIAKFQDLFNEHYYRCVCSARSHPSDTQSRWFSPRTSRLSSLLGIKQPFFCTLDLLQASASDSLLPTINTWQSPSKTYLQHAIHHVIQAMDELDNSCAFSKRLYVPPTYAELRKIINIAQVAPVCTTRRSAVAASRFSIVVSVFCSGTRGCASRQNADIRCRRYVVSWRLQPQSGRLGG
jgi:hypothetical protein